MTVAIHTILEEPQEPVGDFLETKGLRVSLSELADLVFSTFPRWSPFLIEVLADKCYGSNRTLLPALSFAVLKKRSKSLDSWNVRRLLPVAWMVFSWGFHWKSGKPALDIQGSSNCCWAVGPRLS